MHLILKIQDRQGNLVKPSPTNSSGLKQLVHNCTAAQSAPDTFYILSNRNMLKNLDEDYIYIFYLIAVS